MKKSYCVPLGLALALPLAALVVTSQKPVAFAAAAQEKVVTDGDNGGSVTLNADDVLVVRLKDNPSTGYSRAMVSFPNMPIRLVSYKMLAPAANNGGAPLVGAPRISEWKFEVEGEAKFGRAVWLKMLNLRPFAKGVDPAGLWEIKIDIPQTPAR